MLCAAAAAFVEGQRRRLALLLGAVAVAGILVAHGGASGSLDPVPASSRPYPVSGQGPRLDFLRSPDAGGDWSGLPPFRARKEARPAGRDRAFRIVAPSLLPSAARRATGGRDRPVGPGVAGGRPGGTDSRRSGGIRPARRRSRDGCGARSDRFAAHRRATGVSLRPRIGNPPRSRLDSVPGARGRARADAAAAGTGRLGPSRRAFRCRDAAAPARGAPGVHESAFGRGDHSHRLGASHAGAGENRRLH